MSGVWTCPRNHRWSVPAGVATLEVPPACPECGGPGRPTDAGATLPAADESGPVPPPAEVHVPGYEILAELGRGAMGVVYRAREEALDRPVALKMILAGGHASPADRARFRREAEAAAALRHSNIVQVYAVGEVSGLPFCAQEFIPGGTLADHAAGKPLPPRRAAELVAAVARAVQHAHENGIVHRDLKPANVLLDADGTPKVADFGLAKKLGSGTGPTATGAVLGTPAYMAPEQAEGQAVGPPADVYALGAILYELLTGRPPFQAATPLDTILQVVSTEPPPPRAVNPAVPRDLETVALQCLRKEPGRRYATAAELADDLGRWRAGEPIAARPPGRGERLVRGAKRHRAWLIAGGASALAVSLGWLVQPGRPPVQPVVPTQPAAPPAAPPPPPAVPEPAPTVKTAATLKEAQRAVVGVRSMRAGGLTVGTGFLGLEPGLVVTAIPALGMDHPLTPPPDNIEVVISDVGKRYARLLSLDRTESLACLQVSAVGLPPLVALRATAGIGARQQLFVSSRALVYTIGSTTLTGRVRPRGGAAPYLQIPRGGLELSPGSAVLDTDGRLVGITVAGTGSDKTVTVTPAEAVVRVLHQRVQYIRPGQAVIAVKSPPWSRLPMTARVADPLNRLSSLSFDVWTGDAGSTRPAKDGNPQAQTGDGYRQTFPLSPRADDRAGPGEDRDFVGHLDLPPLPDHKVYWAQPHFRTSRGAEHWGQAVALPDAGPPVEPVPVRLALNPSAWPAAERRLDIEVRRQVSFRGGGNDRHYTAAVAERSAAADAGVAARLKWRFLNYRFGDADAGQRTGAKDLTAGVVDAAADVDLAADGRMTALRADFGRVRGDIRGNVEGLTRELTETLRAVNPPLLDRALKPGESWPAQSRFEFPSGRSVSKGVFHLTYTYAGARDRGGRREAIIDVGGEVQPPADGQAGGVVGRTVGAFAVDVATGQVRLARVESDMILDMELPGGPGGQPAKSRVGMVLEIRFQRGPADGPPPPAVLPLPNGVIDLRPVVGEKGPVTIDAAALPGGAGRPRPAGGAAE